MRVWRIARGIYSPLDGEGARKYGGRWNSKGVAMVYTAGSLSLAIVETLVHTRADQIPKDMIAFAFEIPDGYSPEKLASLPVGWNNITAPPECQSAGDAWIRTGRSFVLELPSAVVPQESIYLLHPGHPEFSRVKIVSREPFAFDSRLLKTSEPASSSRTRKPAKGRRPR